MKVVYTDDALRDIDQILDWLAGNYQRVAPAVSQRIQHVVARLARWPLSSRMIAARQGVRAVPLGRYPYVIFYRVTANSVEILHVHHSAQALPSADEV